MEDEGRSLSFSESQWKLMEGLLAKLKVHESWQKVSRTHVKLTEVYGRSFGHTESGQKMTKIFWPHGSCWKLTDGPKFAQNVNRNWRKVSQSYRKLTEGLQAKCKVDICQLSVHLGDLPSTSMNFPCWRVSLRQFPSIFRAARRTYNKFRRHFV